MSTTQTFNISFPKELVKQIDTIAESQFGSRSDFLRTAALEYIKKEQEWEYVFREGKKIGAEGKLRTEKSAVAELTKQRRASGRWPVEQAN